MAKKEYVKSFKNPPLRMGVFQIRNTVNGKIFIESTSNLDNIWNRHLLQLTFGNHPNMALQNDWKEYGEPSFVYEVLAELPDETRSRAEQNTALLALGQTYIDKLEPYGHKGYHKKH